MLPRSQTWVRGFSWAAAASAVVLGYFAATRCMDHSQFYRGLFTGVALMVAAILVRLLIAPAALARWTLECGWLVGTGRISYGLYLFHLPVIAWLFPRTVLGYTWRTPLACALTFAAALLSYWLVERPCLRLKDRFRSVDKSEAKPAEVSARAA
jgi:peptidoglycan/LPS O-acetylase OafA/YrhL